VADDLNALNATQGSILGFLHEGPKTGWELLQAVELGLSRFWNVTPSHVYRELQTLAERKLVRPGKREVRDRRSFSITAAGRRAFNGWIAQEPRSEQIRFPLLVKVWFGKHLDPGVLGRFVESSRIEHEDRLRLYEGITTADPYIAAVVAFGVGYERAILAWLASVAAPLSEG